jgi:hypothetical protein
MTVDGVEKCATRGGKSLRKCASNTNPTVTALPALLAANSVSAARYHGGVLTIPISIFQSISQGVLTITISLYQSISHISIYQSISRISVYQSVNHISLSVISAYIHLSIMSVYQSYQ